MKIINNFCKITEELEKLQKTKLDNLESGITVKTINGLTLLGEGNISIGEGGEVFVLEQSDWNEEDLSSVCYIKNKPTLDGYATESWVENKGYLTQHQDLSEYAKRVEIPTKVSLLLNDSKYITTETDPTVPNWAKQASKPTYTAQEIGALPANTPLFSGDYNDLDNKPTNISAFTNDAGYLVEQDIFDDLAAVAISGSYADLKDTPEIPDISSCIKKSSTAGLVRNNGTIDTNTYLTQHQDISGKADKSTTYTKTEVDNLLSNKQNTISDLTDIRNGASSGATAYQKPSTGIPASDIANGVIPTVDYPVTDVKSPNGNSLVVNKIATIPNIYIHNLAIAGDSTTSIFTTIITSFNTSFDVSSLIAYLNNLNEGGFMCSGTVRTNSSGIATGRTAARLVAGNSAETIGIVYHDTGDAGTTGPVYYSAGTGANKISNVIDTVIPIYTEI